MAPALAPHAQCFVRKLEQLKNAHQEMHICMHVYIIYMFMYIFMYIYILCIYIYTCKSPGSLNACQTDSV